MGTRLDTVSIDVGEDTLSGTLLAPGDRIPAVLFVHGWGGCQQHDLVRAREVAGLGCLCLTFDLRGHEENAPQSETVSRADSLEDLLAAYDWLVAERNVDPQSIAVVGISYGGYLGAILTELRPVRWLVLRSPAIYKDKDWALPKRQLHQGNELAAYRRQHHEAASNRALAASAAFTGDVLLVAAEHDEVMPRPVIDSYRTAFANARTLTAKILSGADHALSEKPMQHAYTSMLVAWLTEMMTRARSDDARARVTELKAKRD